MSIETLQQAIIKGEGVIISDGTLNLQHLLPKAYDIIVTYSIEGKDELLTEILSCFSFREEETQAQFESHVYAGLFYQQFYSNVELADDKQELANYLWDEDIYNFFNNIAPEGYSFGSQESDGACIGWFKYETDEEGDEKEEMYTFQRIVFMQGEESIVALFILVNQGEMAALEHLKQWDYDEAEIETDSELPHGYSDTVFKHDNYVLSYNTALGYIGLVKLVEGDEENEI